MASASPFLVESKRNYFIQKQKKKMVHIDLKSLRYKIWLWLVRECELWRTLMQHYTEIPAMTSTKAIAWLLLRCPPVMMLFCLIEKRVRRKLSCVNSVRTRSRREMKERRIIEEFFRTHPYINKHDYASY